MKSDPVRMVPPPPRSYRITHRFMGPAMKLAGLSCRQFAELCAARCDRDLNPGERWRFRFHRLMCGLCRSLPVQFESLHCLVGQIPVDGIDEAEPRPELSTGARERILKAVMECDHPGDPAPRGDQVSPE